MKVFTIILMAALCLSNACTHPEERVMTGLQFATVHCCRSMMRKDSFSSAWLPKVMVPMQMSDTTSELLPNLLLFIGPVLLCS